MARSPGLKQRSSEERLSPGRRAASPSADPRHRGWRHSSSMSFRANREVSALQLGACHGQRRLVSTATHRGSAGGVSFMRSFWKLATGAQVAPFALAVIGLILTPAAPSAVAQGTTPRLGQPAATSDAPYPVEFPRDDGPHEAPIEWWYYTGHLFT